MNCTKKLIISDLLPLTKPRIYKNRRQENYLTKQVESIYFKFNDEYYELNIEDKKAEKCDRCIINNKCETTYFYNESKATYFSKCWLVSTVTKVSKNKKFELLISKDYFEYWEELE